MINNSCIIFLVLDPYQNASTFRSTTAGLQLFQYFFQMIKSETTSKVKVERLVATEMLADMLSAVYDYEVYDATADLVEASWQMKMMMAVLDYLLEEPTR